VPRTSTVPFLATCPQPVLTALTPAVLVVADIPVPPAMAVKTEDAEDPAPASSLAFSTSARVPTYEILSLMNSGMLSKL
jgi:hypothetical protein